MGVDFLPNEPYPRFIYDYGPWWCIVHQMMQAVSVFLFGLSYPSSTSQDNVLLTQYVRKVIRWLRAMHDPVAERAYCVAVSSFKSVSMQHSVDVSAMWRMDDVQEKEVQQNLAGSMAAYFPTPFTQLAVPDNTAVATYSAYDAGTAGTMFSTYNGTSSFSDDHHTGE